MCPHFFEPNQIGHNLVNFEARTSRFSMVVDLEEEEEDRLRRTMTTRITTTSTTTKTRPTIFFFAERNEANPCGAASFSRPRMRPEILVFGINQYLCGFQTTNSSLILSFIFIQYLLWKNTSICMSYVWHILYPNIYPSHW